MNITDLTITGLGDFLSITNAEMGGTLGILLIFMFFGIGFLYLNKKFNTAVSIFLTLSLLLPFATVLFILNLLDSGAFYIYIILLSLSGVFAYLKKGD
jgi:hypothetical protein